MTLADIISTITGFLAPILPYVRKIILFVIPIYIQLGEIFMHYGRIVVNMLPVGTTTLSYIICGVFIVLGLLGGILGKSKKEKKALANEEVKSAADAEIADNYALSTEPTYDF